MAVLDLRVGEGMEGGDGGGLPVIPSVGIEVGGARNGGCAEYLFR